MVAIALKRLLKRSTLLVNAVHAAKEYKLVSWVRTNHEIVERLDAFVANSAGSLKARGGLALEAAHQTFPLLVELVASTSSTLASPLPIDKLFLDAANNSNTSELASLFNKYGSDKSSSHNYDLLYASILGPIRNAPLRVLEIGLGTNNPEVVSTMGEDGRPGASLRAFRDFLPNARIFGADIDHRILFSEDRIQTYFVDQTRSSSFDELSSVLGNNAFDLVIDDGLHSPNANIATMLFAFRALKPSGYFIVEDISLGSIPVWQVVSTLLPADYRPALIQAKNGLLFMVQKPRQ
jgi:hypothetical protein